MAAAVADRKVHAATPDRVAVASKPPGHRVLEAHKARADREADAVGLPWVTRNPVATKADLPVAWASPVHHARHRVDSLTPCARASI